MRHLFYILGIVLLIAAGLIAIGVYISPKNSLKQSDLIVAVSGGDTQARTEEAIRLYEEGWAPELLFSGAALDPESESNAEAMRNLAIDSGVPPDAVLIEEESDNTRENAALSSRLITAIDSERIILVTSPYHQRRTFIEFRAQLDEDIEIINHPAPDHTWSRRFWWRSPFGWYTTVSEIPKIIYSLNQSR